MKWFIKSRVLRIEGPMEFDPSPLSRAIRGAYYGSRTRLRRYPATSEALRKSDLFKQWWYYSMELLPGVVTQGIYPDDFPLLPRMLLRNCVLTGADCLDLGSMEGLVPVLMHRQGARNVLATDASYHCYEKMDAVKRYFDARFDFQQIGSMDDLSSKLQSHGGFDLINLSGVLYHVFSPMHVLSGVRPLLRKNGLMIVSTNVVDAPGYSMEFNDRGKLQREGNTFWYPTVQLFEYMLRYFRLAPIDCIFYPHVVEDAARYSAHVKAGYLSVVCRATDEPALSPDDEWGLRSARGSWEITNLCDLAMLRWQPRSSISYTPQAHEHRRNQDHTIDLASVIASSKPIVRAERAEDSNLLRLSDRI